MMETNGNASDGSSSSSSNGGGGDTNSSLYMQLEKIPVAVQSALSACHNRKILEDISNQAYRQIIRSLQQEMAQSPDEEPQQHEFEQPAILAEICPPGTVRE